MYSGTSLNKWSGNLIGTHQKVDRVARKNLELLGIGDQQFPSSRQILHFEGKDGPDGIKAKSPAQNEPWHYYDPFDDTDTKIFTLIEEHCRELTRALKDEDMVSAAFQAAWLAHTLVDGLTPAHHFPYEEELEKLTGGPVEDRTSYSKKILMPGDNLSSKVQNNWRMWGVKGLLSAHLVFETGVTFILSSTKLKNGLPTEQDIKSVQDLGVVEYFARAARHIALLDMYSRFQESGWTNKLVRDVRNDLGPELVRCVSAVWYDCTMKAQQKPSKKQVKK